MPGSVRSRRPRVVLVRQWDEQVGGSGCCGRLSSVAAETFHGEDPYHHCREDMEVQGVVYRSLREQYDEDQLDLTIADPRNTTWLLPAIWRDARRRGLGPWATLRQVHRGTSPRAVICDGLVLTTDAATPAEAVAAVTADLTERYGPGHRPQGVPS